MNDFNEGISEKDNDCKKEEVANEEEKTQNTPLLNAIEEEILGKNPVLEKLGKRIWKLMSKYSQDFMMKLLKIKSETLAMNKKENDLLNHLKWSNPDIFKGPKAIEFYENYLFDLHNKQLEKMSNIAKRKQNKHDERETRRIDYKKLSEKQDIFLQKIEETIVILKKEADVLFDKLQKFIEDGIQIEENDLKSEFRSEKESSVILSEIKLDDIESSQSFVNSEKLLEDDNNIEVIIISEDEWEDIENDENKNNEYFMVLLNKHKIKFNRHKELLADNGKNDISQKFSFSNNLVDNSINKKTVEESVLENNESIIVKETIPTDNVIAEDLNNFLKLQKIIEMLHLLSYLRLYFRSHVQNRKNAIGNQLKYKLNEISQKKKNLSSKYKKKLSKTKLPTDRAKIKIKWRREKQNNQSFINKRDWKFTLEWFMEFLNGVVPSVISRQWLFNQLNELELKYRGITSDKQDKQTEQKNCELFLKRLKVLISQYQDYHRANEIGSDNENKSADIDKLGETEKEASNKNCFYRLKKLLTKFLNKTGVSKRWFYSHLDTLTKNEQMEEWNVFKRLKSILHWSIPSTGISRKWFFWLLKTLMWWGPTINDNIRKRILRKIPEECQRDQKRMENIINKQLLKELLQAKKAVLNEKEKCLIEKTSENSEKEDKFRAKFKKNIQWRQKLIERRLEYEEMSNKKQINLRKKRMNKLWQKYTMGEIIKRKRLEEEERRKPKLKLILEDIWKRRSNKREFKQNKYPESQLSYKDKKVKQLIRKRIRKAKAPSVIIKCNKREMKLAAYRRQQVIIEKVFEKTDHPDLFPILHNGRIKLLAKHINFNCAPEPLIFPFIQKYSYDQMINMEKQFISWKNQSAVMQNDYLKRVKEFCKITNIFNTLTSTIKPKKFDQIIIRDMQEKGKTEKEKMIQRLQDARMPAVRYKSISQMPNYVAFINMEIKEQSYSEWPNPKDRIMEIFSTPRKQINAMAVMKTFLKYSKVGYKLVLPRNEHQKNVLYRKGEALYRRCGFEIELLEPESLIDSLRKNSEKFQYKEKSKVTTILHNTLPGIRFKTDSEPHEKGKIFFKIIANNLFPIMKLNHLPPMPELMTTKTIKQVCYAMRRDMEITERAITDPETTPSEKSLDVASDDDELEQMNFHLKTNIKETLDVDPPESFMKRPELKLTNEKVNRFFTVTIVEIPTTVLFFKRSTLAKTDSIEGIKIKEKENNYQEKLKQKVPKVDRGDNFNLITYKENIATQMNKYETANKAVWVTPSDTHDMYKKIHLEDTIENTIRQANLKCDFDCGASSEATTTDDYDCNDPKILITMRHKNEEKKKCSGSKPIIIDNKRDLKTITHKYAFQKSCLIIQRILDHNIYADKIIQANKYDRKVEKENEDSLNYLDNDYNLNLQWVWKLKELKEYRVTSMSVHPISKSIVGASYAKWNSKSSLQSFEEEELNKIDTTVDSIGYVCLWNIKHLTQPERKFYFDGNVTNFKFSTQYPSCILVTNQKGYIVIIDFSGKKLKVVMDNRRFPTAINMPLIFAKWFQFNEGIDHPASISLDGQLTWYSKNDLKPHTLFKVPRTVGWVRGHCPYSKKIEETQGLAYNPGERPLVTVFKLYPLDKSHYILGTNEGIVFINSTFSRHSIDKFRAHSGPVGAIDFHPVISNIYLTAGTDMQELRDEDLYRCKYTIRVWGWLLHHKLYEIPLEGIQHDISYCLWITSSPCCIIGTAGDYIFVYDLQREVEDMKVQEYRSPSRKLITSLCFNHNGILLMMADNDGNIYVFTLVKFPFKSKNEDILLAKILHEYNKDKPTALLELAKLGAPFNNINELGMYEYTRTKLNLVNTDRKELKKPANLKKLYNDELWQNYNPTEYNNKLIEFIEEQRRQRELQRSLEASEENEDNN